MTLDFHLGFTRNPFSKKSSEQELDFLDDIFFEPNYYQALMDDLLNGDSRFIIGQRGHGKSSIINKLLEDLESKNLLIIKIDRFDSIPLKRNETALIKLILKYIVIKLSAYLFNNKKALKQLNKIDKEKLAFFHRVFYGTLSKNEYKDVYNCYHNVKRKNWLIRQFNRWGLGPVNAASSAFINMASDAVRQSLGLDKVDPSTVYKDYFGVLDEIKIDKINIDKENYSKESLKQLLDDILSITRKVGFSNTTILFDKIDEFQELNQDITQIGNFTKEILSDTELLMNERLAIGFSLWSELKSELAGKVRFDKFSSIDVRWLSRDLVPLINKRIKYFSVNKDLTLEILVPLENEREQLIKVANKSPRDLISVLSEIYQDQSNTNQVVTCFESPCVHRGIVSFCVGYDYDSIYPSSSKAGKGKEIWAMVKRLLSMQLTRFTVKQLTDTFGQSTAQSEGQIKVMESYKLIREDDILGPNNEVYYEVIDPKVEYLIKHAITNIE